MLMQSWRFLRKSCNEEPRTRRPPQPLGLPMGNLELWNRTCTRLKVPPLNRQVAVESVSWIRGPRWWWARGSSHRPLKTRWNPLLLRWRPQLPSLRSSRSPKSQFLPTNRMNIVGARTWARWCPSVHQSSPKIVESRLPQSRHGLTRVTEPRPLVS